MTTKQSEWDYLNRIDRDTVRGLVVHIRDAAEQIIDRQKELENPKLEVYTLALAKYDAKVFYDELFHESDAATIKDYVDNDIGDMAGSVVSWSIEGQIIRALEDQDKSYMEYLGLDKS